MKIFFTVLLFISSHLFATGASWLKFDIIPVGLNSSGDVLCKAYTQYNPMGSHKEMPITFKYLIVFSDGRIEEIDYLYFDPDIYFDYDDMRDHQKYWLDYHKRDLSSLSEDLSRLILKYKFKPLKISAIEVNSVYRLSDFSTTPVQTTIGGYKSVNSIGFYKVKYKVGNLWFIKNYSNSNSGVMFGSEFNIKENIVGGRFLTWEVFSVIGIVKIK